MVGGSFLAALLVKMAIGVLDYFLARKGIRDGVKKDIALAGERLAKNAEHYKAENPVNLAPGDLFGPLRVRGFVSGRKPGISGDDPDDS